VSKESEKALKVILCFLAVVLIFCFNFMFGESFWKSIGDFLWG
jgi:hypothetical protein